MLEAAEFSHELYGAGLVPSWYFPDAELARKGVSSTIYWEYSIHSGYPVALHVHFRHLGADHNRQALPLGNRAKRRVELRRWIERNLDGDVIHAIDDRSYGLETDTVRHGYHVFLFETEHDANHFLLRFADIVELPTDYDETDPATQEQLQCGGQLYHL
jgi:hypothetical protein